MFIIDSHVHIYDCYNIGLFLDCALRNFRSARNWVPAQSKCRFVIMLAEGHQESWFDKHRDAIIKSGNNSLHVSESWILHLTESPLTLKATKLKNKKDELYIIAGKQLVSKEKIEILALCSRQSFDNDMPATEAIDNIKESGAIPILPWGVGKWLGKRGDLIEQLVRKRGESGVFLGDNGGRPAFWATPKAFKEADSLGIAVLPGTDPLPLPHEHSRVGSYGFFLENASSGEDEPAEYIRKVFSFDQPKITPYGSLMNPIRFFRNQIQIRINR